MPADLHTGHRDSRLLERLRHRPGFQERNDFILELVAIHRRDQIDQAALGTTGVETRDQMTDSDRQGLANRRLRQDAALLQESDDVIGQVFGALLKSIQDQFGRFRMLVWRIQTGEVA